MNSYDDIKLEVVKSLNSSILNNAFKKLYSNDNEIVPANDYTPNIWENKWYNDEVIPGYPKGYCVWRNAYTNISSFLSSYGDLVYDYAKSNPLLETYLLSSWTQLSNAFYDKTQLSNAFYDNLPLMEVWRQRYYNVISGYSKEVSSWYEGSPPRKKTKWEQLLPPLFDYGPYSGTDDLRVELYVSLQDDNKEMLSNSNAWSNVVLSSQAEYEKFIKTEVDILFAEHLKNYHLDGSLTPSEINDVLLANNLSNFAIEDVQNTIEVKDHDAYMNTDGFDYVVDFKRFAQQAGNSLAPGKNFYLYRWYRLWNSGFLEHGGVVRCNPIPSADYEVSNPDNYIVKVDLTWGLGDKATAVYNYDETSGNSFGETYERYYYGNRRGDPSFPIYQQIDPEEKFLNGKHYFARVTPVVLLSSDVNLGTYAYNSISSLAEHDYLSVATSNKVSSYVTVEVHHLKNDSFCFTRSDTDKLDGSAVQYYQYYVTGFKKIIPVDYDFGHATVEGVNATYVWTGSAIKPNPTVKNNLGDILQQDRDYSLLYYAPGGKEADFIDGPEVNIQVKGLKPYVGMQTLQYKIVKTK